jgi:phosphatidylglycerol:prolipoprotein diacylglycerol transferase
MHPTLFRIGPVDIRFYGLMYVIAIVACTFLLQREVRRKKLGLTKDEVISYVFYLVIGGILGARVYYVLFMWEEFYMQYPLEIFAIWHGGLAIHGGIIGGIAVTLLFAKRKNVRFLDICDATAPTLALGQAIGRVGNFMNGDAHGLPTPLPWGIVFPGGSAAGDEFPGQPLHPVMLYELALNLVNFFILWKLRKLEHKRGFILALYLLNYGIIRFFVSFLRADSLMLRSLRGAQIISVVFVCGSLLSLLLLKLWKSEPGEMRT